MREYCLELMGLSTYQCDLNDDESVIVKDIKYFVSAIFPGEYQFTQQGLMIKERQITLPREWTVDAKKRLYTDIMQCVESYKE